MKSETYTIRVQICQKCYQHYNQGVNPYSKSCHNLKKVTHQNQRHSRSSLNFIQEEQQYNQHLDTLISEINNVQNDFFQRQLAEHQRLSFKLKDNKQVPRSVSSNRDSIIIPTFNIHRNKPFKYLTKVADTKLSSKRYLNQCTNKIVQFPRKDSFEIYFQNLLIFSKLSYKQWPNQRLVAKIIKTLVEYSEKNGPLMERLSNFINPEIEIKCPDQNQNSLTLYEYLLLSSDCTDPLIQGEENQNKLIKVLKQIISGRTTIIPFNQTDQNDPERKAVLPYTIFDPKIKTTTMVNIYLGKKENSTTTERINKHKQQRIPHNNNNQTFPIENKTLNKTMTEVTKRTYRPLLTNTSYKHQAHLSNQSRSNNQIFTMIKTGDFEQNFKNQNNKETLYFPKSLHKQISTLCSQNNKISPKKKNDLTNKTKLFLSSNFQIVKNPERKVEQESIIWTNFTKATPFNHNKRDSGSHFSMNFNLTDGFFNAQNQNDFKMNDDMDENMTKHHKSKIVPSKKIERASLFLNEQQKILAEQLKELQSKAGDNDIKLDSQEKNPEDQDNKKKHFKKRSHPVGKKHSFSPSSSQGNSQKQQLQLHDEQMRQQYKLNVVKESLSKRRSDRNSLNVQKNNHLGVDYSSLMTKSPSKLTVKSRRKSSFYYSNTQNNSLMQLNKLYEAKDKRDHGHKKLKRKVSERKSKVVNNTVSRVEEGVQVNMQQDMIQAQQNTSQENQQLGPNDHCIYNSKIPTYISSNFIKNSWPQQQNEQKAANQKSSQNSKQKRNLSLKRNGQFRLSNINKISKISFINQLGLMKQKDQNLMTVFPENKFQHAFIVQKFTQKDSYELEVMRNFTTNVKEKSIFFQFQITCEQQYQAYQVESLKVVFERFGTSEKSMVLFPKIFQQIENYSTPLVEVVNRLLKFHPIAISRLFTNAHGISPLGQYCIWVYHKDINQFKPVYINDQVPFYENEYDVNSFMLPRKLKIPVYGPITNQNSIWFILLQKALAKVAGSYYKLNEIPIGDLFRMLTGCPVVNIQHFTNNKLQKIFGEQIFLKKKAYVYALRRQNSLDNLRIDRVIGIEKKEAHSNGSCTIVKIEEKQNAQANLDMQTLVRKYDHMALVFFNLSFVFNQMKLPNLIIQDEKSSNLISFYITTEETNDKNQLYICLGGFQYKNLNSKIIIYRETQQNFNQNLKQLQFTDPLGYYEKKYTYQGEIEKTGNYFFETELKYGRYLCLIEANFEQNHQYFISTYSSKPVTIHQGMHNYILKQTTVVDPLQRIIDASIIRRKLKNCQNISNEDGFAHISPIKVLQQNIDFDQDLIPYDFKNYQSSKHKHKKFKSSDQIDQNSKGSKWVIDKQFIQDQYNIEQKKEKHISHVIKQVQKVNKKNQFNKFKKQLQTQFDPMLKMISRIEDKSKYISSLNQKNEGEKEIKKKKSQGLKNIQLGSINFKVNQ